MEPRIQHWLMGVVRSSGIRGGEDLEVGSESDSGEAWRAVGTATGLTDEELALQVADHFGLEIADLDEADPQAHRLVPARVARKLGVLPMGYSDRTLTVATSDPVSLETERALGRVSDRTVVFRLAPPARIVEKLEEVYPEEDPAPHEIPRLSPEARGVPHILVVDDEADTRLLLQSVLEKEGFEVTEAKDGPEALELLKGDLRFSLVTLDLMMPAMGGLEVLEQMRDRRPTRDLPVVVATAKDDPEVEVRLFEAGADDFIVKPLDPRRFVLRVRAVLRRHRPWLVEEER